MNDSEFNKSCNEFWLCYLELCGLYRVIINELLKECASFKNCISFLSGQIGGKKYLYIGHLIFNCPIQYICLLRENFPNIKDSLFLCLFALIVSPKFTSQKFYLYSVFCQSCQKHNFYSTIF